MIKAIAGAGWDELYQLILQVYLSEEVLEAYYPSKDYPYGRRGNAMRQCLPNEEKNVYLCESLEKSSGFWKNWM